MNDTSNVNKPVTPQNQPTSASSPQSPAKISKLNVDITSGEVSMKAKEAAQTPIHSPPKRIPPSPLPSPTPKLPSSKEIKEYAEEMSPKEGMSKKMESDLLEIQSVAFRQIGLGKAKKILMKLGEKHTVYLIPRNVDDKMNVLERTTSLFINRTQELRQEVLTVKNIRANLFKQDLIACLSGSDDEFIRKHAQEIARRISEQYGIMENFQKVIESNDYLSVFDTRLNITNTDNHVEKIVKLIKDNSGELRKEKNIIFLEEEAKQSWLDGLYTAKMAFAEGGDLEKLLKNKKMEFPLSGKICLQIVNGMKELHRSGHLHRDVKPDNILVFEEDGETVVRIADFGKTKPVTSTDRYTGNNRFVAPEIMPSPKGETYSTGLLLIRVLEQELLRKRSVDMLLTPSIDSLDTTVQPKPSRKGIERFLIVNNRCPQTDTDNLYGKVRALTSSIVQTGELIPQFGGSFIRSLGGNQLFGFKNPQTEIYKYIDKLIEGLKKAYPDRTESFNALSNVLKDMTSTEIEERPTLEEAQARLAPLLG